MAGESGESWRGRVAARARWLRGEVAALTVAMGNRRTPWLAKVVAGLAVCYALSPIDLIPDVIPVLGYLDDLLILPALIALAIRLIPHEVMEQARTQVRERQQGKGRQRWVYAIPIIVVWLILAAVIARIMWSLLS